jgi:hypothetical protein
MSFGRVLTSLLTDMLTTIGFSWDGHKFFARHDTTFSSERWTSTYYAGGQQYTFDFNYDVESNNFSVSINNQIIKQQPICV